MSEQYYYPYVTFSLGQRKECKTLAERRTPMGKGLGFRGQNGTIA